MLRRAVLLIGLLAGALPAAADTWPSKPVKVIVPFPAGGSGDLAARPYAEMLSKKLGQQFVVENRSGAGGAIGVEATVRAPADGYTVLFASSSPVLVLPQLRKTPYEYGRDLIVVARLADAITGIGVHPSVGAKNVKELVAAAKAKPGGMSFGSAGIGTTTHLSGEVFKRAAQIDMLHVPYKGTGEAIADLLAGHIQLIFDPVIYASAKGGKLNLIGVTGSVRHPDFPEVPTLTEAGLSNAEVPIQYTAYFPAGTPAETVSALNAAIVAIAKEPEFKTRMLSAGFVLNTESVAEAAAHAKRDYDTYGQIIRAAEIKFE
jgi:tripartite-type tricarboxylate transporter receptor subunit TctC